MLECKITIQELYKHLKLQYSSFSDHFLAEYIGASIYLYYTPAYLYIYIY